MVRSDIHCFLLLSARPEQSARSIQDLAAYWSCGFVGVSGFLRAGQLPLISENQAQVLLFLDNVEKLGGENGQKRPGAEGVSKEHEETGRRREEQPEIERNGEKRAETHRNTTKHEETDRNRKKQK